MPSEGTPAIKATLEAGKIYYVEIGVTIERLEPARASLCGRPAARKLGLAPEVALGADTMLVPNEPAGQAYVRGRSGQLLRGRPEGNDELRGLPG